MSDFLKTIWEFFWSLVSWPWKKSTVDKKYASFNRRMLAATIDSLLAMLTLTPILDYIVNLYAPLPPLDLAALQAEADKASDPAAANLMLLRHMLDAGYVSQWLDNLLLQTLALALVTGACWHFWAATPGKMLLKMKVVDAKTEAPISDSQIALRLLGYVVATLPLCLGFVWIGLSKRRQGWHDMLADTVVVVTQAPAAAARSDSPEPSTAE